MSERVHPSLVAGYVTVPVPVNQHDHLCSGCAFDDPDITTEQCLDVECCEGVIFRRIGEEN